MHMQGTPHFLLCINLGNLSCREPIFGCNILSSGCFQYLAQWDDESPFRSNIESWIQLWFGSIFATVNIFLAADLFQACRIKDMHRFNPVAYFLTVLKFVICLISPLSS